MALKVKHFAECPHCGEGEFAVDHLWEPGSIGRERGPWYCDECGRGALLKAIAPGIVDVSKSDASMPRTLNLLSIPPRDHPVYLVVHGVRSSDDPGNDGGTAYFYNEHTCPTNWTDQIEAVIEDGDPDPHGVAQFIRSVDTPELPDGEIEYDLQNLFPEAFDIEGATIIDGELADPIKRIA